MDKDVFTMEYYSSMRKKEILPFVMTWMDLQAIMLNEVSQTEKDKYWSSHLYVKSKKLIDRNSK